jgi:hypothetical protein
MSARTANWFGVEILYPSLGDVDLEPLREQYGLQLRVPFRFAA